MNTAKALRPIEQFRIELNQMEGELWKVLPSNIKPEKFIRVVMKAVQGNADLMACTRQSLFGSCMLAARDGLLPDGREGAIVPFGENEAGVKQSDRATWIPMVAGIRLKILRSGEVADLRVREVREGDEFDYIEGDEPRLFHRPLLVGGHSDRPIRYVYSIAKFHTGELSRYVMTIDQIEEIRQKYSKSKKGPWNNPITYPEMCKKTVLRRHAKELPQCTDLQDIVHRDDELFDVKEPPKPVGRPRTATAALSDFGAARERRQVAPPPAEPTRQQEPPRDGPVVEHDADGVVVEDQSEPQETFLQLVTRLTDTNKIKTPDDVTELLKTLMSAASAPADGEVLQRWWSSETMRKLRTRAGIEVSTANAWTGEIEELAAALRQQ